jgi:hypothetical protein
VISRAIQPSETPASAAISVVSARTYQRSTKTDRDASTNSLRRLSAKSLCAVSVKPSPPRLADFT